MEVYVARQPIFDRKMGTYGYELLYRRSKNNFFEGISDDQATAELINNAFLVMRINELTNGTRAFINFSTELLEQEIPLLLPKESIVVEILERVEPTASVVNACKILKSQGYMLALDDFVFHDSYLPLLKIADIVKIEFPTTALEKQRQLIKGFSNIRFLAEKIETRKDYHIAKELGYDFFQGYFFSKPVILSGNELVGLNANLVRLINEMNNEESDYSKISQIIERDLGLSYKLLKLANSIFFASKYRIASIKQAIVRLGSNEIKRWLYLMMLKEIQSIENKELIKNCLVRGKLMDLIATELGNKTNSLEFFMTGMFSSIDVLLNRSMSEIVDELPLSTSVKEALLGRDNELRRMLNSILLLEAGSWTGLENSTLYHDIHRDKCMLLYIQSLKWAMELDY